LGPEAVAASAQGARPLSPEERRKEGFEHMWRGVWWLIGGLAVTLISYNLAILGGGGKYVVTTGIMLYGVSQIIRGAVQVYGPQRN
jgi:hypothetical protein